jgi:hypothetical protein
MPETIFNSYFLVSFRSDSIITWGKKEDMYGHHDEFIHIDLAVVTFDELTMKMKSSIKLYTNKKEKYA